MAETRQQALVNAIGRDVAAKLLDSLPRIAQGMKQDGATASFSATVQFKTNREGELECEVTGRERIPIEPTTFKVALHGDQLRLFEGVRSSSADEE